MYLRIERRGLPKASDYAWPNDRPPPATTTTTMLLGSGILLNSVHFRFNSKIYNVCILQRKQSPEQPTEAVHGNSRITV